MSEALVLALAFLATVCGVAIFRRLGTYAGILDVPNERSSHKTPTLRGAGIVVVVVCLSLYIVSASIGDYGIQWTYVIGGSVVAAVSWLDDLYKLPAIIRFIAHGCAASIVIAGCGPIESVYIPLTGSTVNLGVTGTIVTFLWIVWLVNAYNFMDGIDGIAGTKAVIAGLAWAAFGYFSGGSAVHMFGAIIAAASLGFLFHNWNPAAVFMGDVGSAFLGFTFATMPLLASNVAPRPTGWALLAAIGFVWPFLFDSVFTFTRRVIKGEKVWQAHRQHLYQRMVISGSTHGTVSLIYGITGAVISIVFMLTFLNGGIWEIFLVLSLLISAAAFLILAGRSSYWLDEKKD